tara:strand:- start:272 stop:421 length:150 start_codon:yes stop_codon:yes gene_type:complete
MKVYVVFTEDGDLLVGAFSTQEKAEAYIEREIMYGGRAYWERIVLDELV